MLYPQSNTQRMVMSLDGFWRFAKDESNHGESKGWQNGIPSDRLIAVPASWNEQYQDLMQFFETGWYERDVEVPNAMDGQQVWLRIGGANYLSKVWFNGQYLGEHEGGHLPFEFNVTRYVKFGQVNQITVSVYVKIKPDSLPPGEVEHEQIIQKNGVRGQFPRNYYDFFPYGGINRSVSLYTTPDIFIQDMTVNTDIEGSNGIVHYQIQLNQPYYGDVKVKIEETEQVIVCSGGQTVSGTIVVEDARFWSVGQPNLYDLEAFLTVNDRVMDKYRLRIGIRSVRIEGTKFLLNGEPVFMNGFGMHEDFPVLGKGTNHAVIAKDLSLLQWMGGNSMRTSHYPYSEEFLNYADENGILVIGETPFVGMVRSLYNETILAKANRVIGEMISRDKNHPSIIAWSLANEPDSFVPEAEAFFKGLYDHAKSLDPSRPATMVNCLTVEGDKAIGYFDFICINRYYGWYSIPGLLDEGCERLSDHLDTCYNLYGKPVMVTEFGADAIPGLHRDPPELFSEEYQAEMVIRQYEVIRSKPYTIGAHVWVLADFKTSQQPKRVVLNWKGLFTRDRQPKLAATHLRKVWLEEKK
jgi:beta-glucuronidase